MTFTAGSSAHTSPVVIETHNFACGYGQENILSGVTFSLKAGQALGLIGANGSGKSTLLKGIIGLCRTSGTITQHGHIGYVPQHQDVDLSFPVTGRQVVEMGLYPHTPWWKKVDRKKVSAAIALVGLEHKADARFGDLSGGQRQRILIARALVTEPTLILLDEPFNGLDVDSRKVLVNTIKTLKKHGTAIIVSTHDYELADQVCERCAEVSNGRIVVKATEHVIGTSA
ncbi:ABC transporter ATP-binding protein [Corynebacterium felinum]|uniref:ABC-type Mn2+/Zn2+ transport system ATPase subunit n=1 Tax=Corynebacterium felinum TaxID=131318 RepID=A0ABU2B5V1_9CORY|nr:MULTISPECIES: ABC transporter ATP-binding protein [Corynebacterium]MDF5821479.1 ABC transporter ATP-binding protein [Corynebacterium felinum]MDO4761192.1 ABC transporter ATP-binding protein [Corynebacterium sp.]MDR7353997.1 ABC-type Mn2+/Zn2+ transport system ATPase subunit [Corynebacterium felinum]WJY96171.1 High-affinity zinc uptake system ATP-binding protein ZnuC [Corynebacterium felinum]